MADPYPLWLKVRLETMFDYPPRFENSFYGPIDGILNTIFPVIQKFLVKPQAILIPSLPTVSSIYLPPGTDPHPDASRSSSRIAKTAATKAGQWAGSTSKAAHWQGPGAASTSHSKKSSVSSISSIDSLGDNVLPRSEGGWIEGLLIPDFLVVKATESKTRDLALVLVEVKLYNTDEPTSINQVEVYLTCLQTKNYSDKFVAFLCMGPRSCVWKTSGQGNNLMQNMLPDYVTTGSMEFCNLMLPARLQHWW